MSLALFTEEQLLDLPEKFINNPSLQDEWAGELKRRNLTMVLVPSLVRRSDHVIVAVTKVGTVVKQYIIQGEK